MIIWFYFYAIDFVFDWRNTLVRQTEGLGLKFERNGREIFNLEFDDVKLFIQALRQSYLCGLFFQPWKQDFVKMILANYKEKHDSWDIKKNPFEFQSIVEESFKQIKLLDANSFVFDTKFSIDTFFAEVYGKVEHFKSYGRLDYWSSKPGKANENNLEFDKSIENPPAKLPKNLFN
jgi:hypothetical protein